MRLKKIGIWIAIVLSTVVTIIVLSTPAQADELDVQLQVDSGVNDNEYAITGSRVRITAIATCNDTTTDVTRVKWTIPDEGKPVKDWVINRNQSQLVEINNFEDNPIDFYFTAKSDAATVSAEVTATCGQEQEQTVMKSNEFVVYGASLDTDLTEDLKIGITKARYEVEYEEGGEKGDAIVIGLVGTDDEDEGNPGVLADDIAVELDEEIEPEDEDDTGGTIGLFQVITNANSKVTYGDDDSEASECLIYSNALDDRVNGIEYESNDANKTLLLDDSPANHFFVSTYPDITETSIDFSAETTLMYRPNGDNTIYVPVARATWSFSGTGRPNPDNYHEWNTESPAPMKTDFAATDKFPAWSINGATPQWELCSSEGGEEGDNNAAQ